MMDVFNVFWSMILYLITYLFIFKKFNQIKFKINCISIVLLIFLSIVMTILSVNKLVIATIISNLFATILLCYFNYKLDIIKTLYYSIVMWIAALVADAIVSVIFLTKNFAVYIEFIKQINFRTILALPVIIIEIFICMLIKNIVVSFYDKYIVKIKYNMQLIVTILSLIYMMFWMFSINAFKVINAQMRFIIFLITLMIIIMVILILYYMYKSFSVNECNNKIIQESDFIKKVASKDKIFKHNIINNLMGIETIANKKSKVLINDLIKKYTKDYKIISNINDVPNGLQGIIYQKTFERNYSNLNLVVENNISKEIYGILKASKYNLFCETFGILLDNALEAVKELDEKVINIIFDENENNIVVTLSNNFSNIIDFDNIGKTGYTSKKFGHGLGLVFILNKKDINILSNIINIIFYTIFEIKKNK